MEPVASPVPSPSVAWSHLAAVHGDGLPVETPVGSARTDDASQLRARLLRLIVDREQTRKAAAAEPFHAR